MIPGVTSKPDKRPALKVLLYGQPKIGKTTWASGAPKPLLLAFEDGANFIDVDRVRLEHWDAKSAAGLPSYQSTMHALLEGKHDYQTVIIDTVGAAYECMGEVVSRDKLGGAHVDSLKFGDGHKQAVPLWRNQFMMQLDALNDHGINVIVIAHTEPRRISNPHGEDYIVDDIKLHKIAAAIVREWADFVLFANFVTSVTNSKDMFEKSKATGGTIRTLEVSPRASTVAGNRCGLTKNLPLTYTAFEKALKQ